MPLKDLEIRALKPQDGIYKRTDERGLYIEVRPNGSKLWRFKYNFLGKDKRIAFGSYPEVGLAEARRKRDEFRQKVRDGIDPVGERKREKLVAKYNAANSFGEVAKEYIDKMVREGRADTTTTKANWLLEQLAPIETSAIADLKPVDVLGALKRIEAKGIPEAGRSGSTAMAFIESIRCNAPAERSLSASPGRSSAQCSASPLDSMGYSRRAGGMGSARASPSRSIFPASARHPARSRRALASLCPRAI